MSAALPLHEVARRGRAEKGGAVDKVTLRRVRAIIAGSVVGDALTRLTGVPAAVWRTITFVALAGYGKTSDIELAWLSLGLMLEGKTIDDLPEHEPARSDEKARLRKVGRDAIKAAEEWQKESGFRFFRRLRGGMRRPAKAGNTVPSRYELPVIDVLNDALVTAKADPRYRKGGAKRARAIGDALARYLPELRAKGASDDTTRDPENLCGPGRPSTLATVRRGLGTVRRGYARADDPLELIPDIVEAVADLATDPRLGGPLVERLTARQAELDEFERIRFDSTQRALEEKKRECAGLRGENAQLRAELERLRSGVAAHRDIEPCAATEPATAPEPPSFDQKVKAAESQVAEVIDFPNREGGVCTPQATEPADPYADLAANAEEDFGSAEDAPPCEYIPPVEPGGPVLTADTSRTRVNFDGIPTVLTPINHWTTWRREQNEKGRPTKMPYRPALPTRKASSTKPNTWATFQAARAVYEREENGFDGVFFTMTEELELVGIDLDHCVDPETGAIEPWALAVAHRLNSYTELSPSRTGLRILCRGKKPGDRCKAGTREMYSKLRFLSLTGWHVEGTPTTIEERTEQIAAVYHEWFPREASPAPALPASPTLLSDSEVIALGERICPNFSALWAGGTCSYPSPSEARSALHDKLAFLTGGDVSQMVRLFRLSGQMSAKCETKRGGVSLVEYEARRRAAKARRFYEPRPATRGQSAPGRPLDPNDSAPVQPAEPTCPACAYPLHSCVCEVPF
jgi:putative DNA primase/helicase